MSELKTNGGILPDIKLFVSHRIDINSELIDNPLYVPVRCGAVFDKENPMNIAGDDTGDNISEKRMSLCEFTVQYWAWKNVQADYYGLCHYRRYLSFADKRYKTNEFNMIHSAELTPSMKKKLGLLNSKEMSDTITRYDIVTSEYADVSKIPLTEKIIAHTVRELWDAHDGLFFEKYVIDEMFRIIDEKFPEYSESAREYFSGDKHRGFNCFVMKKDLFFRMCEFQFPVMEEIADIIDTTGYTQTMCRTPAFIGEMLYGIFIYHVTNKENASVKEQQLAFFASTDKFKNNFDLFCRIIAHNVDKLARIVFDPIFPKGTKRRERLKKVYYGITGAKRRGEADIKNK